MSAGRRTRWFHGAILVVGVIALAFLIDRLGWAGMRQVLVGTGGWFAVIAAIDLCSVMCDAFAIHGFLRATAPIAYPRVFAAQASGLAINRLTPANSLGEPVKITMLARDVPVHAAVSAIVMFNLTTIYVGVAAIVIGVPVTALMLDLPHDVAVAVWIGTAILVALAVAVALIIRRGAVSSLIDAGAAIHVLSPARAARWRLAMADIDARLRDLGDARASGVRRGLIGVLGSRALNWTGTVVVLHATGVAMTPPLVVAMLSVGILITWMSNIVPLGVGLADGGNYALYAILGAAPDAGLVFAMVNRLRTCALAIMGLIVMAIASLFARGRTSASRDDHAAAAATSRSDP